MSAPQCSVISLTDTELTALVQCARGRVIFIAPGLSEVVANALAHAWQRLGRDAVQIVLDPDPEVCRLGFGELSALQLLHRAAEQIGARIHQQRGLRIGIVVTDESTAIFSPTPLLIEAGGLPGEKPNAIRLDRPLIQPTPDNGNSELGSINIEPVPLKKKDVQRTAEDLSTNPPVKFDLARKVRVFNARFEFVDFELRGLAISRKTVRIPSDLFGLAKEPKAQKLLRSSFQLIDKNSEISGERVNKLKQFITKKYLIVLPGYGTVILRGNKEDFQTAVKALERYVHRFQRLLKKKLQAAIDTNREILVSALLPSVVGKPPSRWNRFLADGANKDAIEQLLRSELARAFGSAEALFDDMKVKAVFKAVTYESLSEPEFIRVARAAIPSFDCLHEEFDAAKAEPQEHLFQP